jgi:sugar lactone lactonase YvrE
LGTTGGADGTNTAARFNFPGGAALDPSGSFYVADILNHTIRKLARMGTNWVVTTIAGLAGMQGSADGTNSDALFDRPNAIAVDQAGTLFVTDHYNHTIRQIQPQGTNWIVTTIAGLVAVHGNADGTNSNARFWSPTGITIDSQGRLFVVDTANFTIRQITPVGTNWVVSTIAGLPLNFGFADGTNADALFDYPYGITMGAAGRLYVTDWGNYAIRELSPVGSNWVVTTIAGSSGVIGSQDGPGPLATFNLPNGICADRQGNLFVADQSNDTIRELVPSAGGWTVSTIAGAALQSGSSDGLGSDARLRHPWGIVADNAGSLLVTDYGNQTIRLGVIVPWLRITEGAQGIAVSWSAAATGYTIESSPGLGPTALWAGLTNSIVTNGANLILAGQPNGGTMFYRLRKAAPSSGTSP